MKPAEYHRAAARTRVAGQTYKDALCNAGLKLSGEAGEVLQTAVNVGSVTRAEKIAELGDVCWYIALIADTIGADADHLWETYDPVVAVTWFSAGVHLTLAATATSENIGKHLYHGKDKALIVSPLSRTVAAVYACAAVLGVPIEDVWATNVEKLKARWPDGFKRTDSGT